MKIFRVKGVQSGCRLLPQLQTLKFKANYTNALIGLILPKIARVDELKNSWAPSVQISPNYWLAIRGRKEYFTLSTSDEQLPKNVQIFWRNNWKIIESEEFNFRSK